MRYGKSRTLLGLGGYGEEDAQKEKLAAMEGGGEARSLQLWMVVEKLEPCCGEDEMRFAARRWNETREQFFFK